MLVTMRVAAVVYCDQRRPRGHPPRPRSVTEDFYPATPNAHITAAFQHRWGVWTVRCRLVLSIFCQCAPLTLLRLRRCPSTEFALSCQRRRRAARKTQIRQPWFERGQSPGCSVDRSDCRSRRRVGLDRAEQPSCAALGFAIGPRARVSEIAGPILRQFRIYVS